MKVIVTLITIFFSSIIFAQIDTIEINDNIQSLLEDASLDKEDPQLYDLLEELINNPIDINSASLNQLLQIPFLGVLTADAIIRYRNLHGKFSSLNELKNINELNNELIDKIIPFIQINKLGDNLFTSIKNIFNEIKMSNRLRTIQDIQIRKGFSENKFAGSKQKVYNRFLITSENYFRAGLITEKDAGEKSLSDFSSYHFQLKNFSIFSNITLGDYIFEFGQGLALWGPYSFSKGIDAINIVNRNERGIIPYISTDENQFMRGVSMNINLQNLTFSPFYSFNKIDASLDSTTGKINSIILDGYHRTPNEIEKKDKLEEKIIGLAAHFSFNDNNKIGLLYYRSKFSNELNIHDKFSNIFDYYSLSYSSLIKKLNLSGEFTYNKNSIASINTAQIVADKNLSFVFSYRNYPVNFINLHGNSFGEKSAAQNEIGFYTGIYFHTPFGSFNLYYDQFKNLTTSNSLKFSSGGNEFLVYYSHKISPNTEMRLKYKHEEKEIESNVGDFKTLVNRKTENFRLEILFHSSQKLKLKTRIEVITLSQMQRENGFLISQDLHYAPYKTFQFYGRIIFFRTDSYNSRLYEYENDLTGVTTIPALFGDGLRWYFMIKYKTNFGITLSLKYSELYKPNEKSLGSSYNEIEGNLDNKLSLQIDWKL